MSKIEIKFRRRKNENLRKKIFYREQETDTLESFIIQQLAQVNIKDILNAAPMLERIKSFKY